MSKYLVQWVFDDAAGQMVPEVQVDAPLPALPTALADTPTRTSIESGLTDGLAALQQIIDAPQVTFSNLAQAQTAVQQIQTAVTAEARQLRRLSRLALGLLDGTD